MAKNLLITGMIVLLMACAPKTEQPAKSEETIKQDAKMKWWREARFGMFIHWGLYAVPAGEWKGEQIPGISEWIMLNAKIPVAEYENLTGNFNPVKFNAEEWVLLAKNAGMKYIVITSKHHDGFAMFHSLASKYNIYDATPFKRDPLKELADACKKHGIRLGFYYSQAQDWHESGGTYRGIDKGIAHWDPNLKRDSLMNYINGKALPQVKEILENYGGLDILWWDTPIGMTEEAAKVLQAEAAKYPEMITNNRLYRPWKGDFTTPEQHIPPTGLDYDWEVCMTMNTSWGYKWYDNNWKSSADIIQMLVDIASKGGNFLLNVGPTSEGLIPDSSIVRLKKVGEWMKKYGESVYGTSASPFFKLTWGRCTQKSENGNTTLYLHVFNWPKDQIIRLPGLRARIKDAYMLTNNQYKVAWKFENGDAILHVPSVSPDPVNTVIVVQVKGTPEITSNKPVLKDGIVLLPAAFADIHNPGYGKHAILDESREKPVITNWVDQRTRLEWLYNTSEPGNYEVEAQIKADSTSAATIKIGDQKISAEIKSTGNAFQTVSLGEIKIEKSGDQVISFTPLADKWKAIELTDVRLKRK